VPHTASSGTASFRRQNQRARTRKEGGKKTRPSSSAPPLQRAAHLPGLQLRALATTPTGHTARATRSRPARCRRATQLASPRLAALLLLLLLLDLLCHRPPGPLPLRPVRVVKSRGSPGGIMPPVLPTRGHERWQRHAAASIPDCVRASMHARLLVRTRPGAGLFVPPSWAPFRLPPGPDRRPLEPWRRTPIHCRQSTHYC
jgi:hypothetical protein